MPGGRGWSLVGRSPSLFPMQIGMGTTSGDVPLASGIGFTPTYQPISFIQESDTLPIVNQLVSSTLVVNIAQRQPMV